MNHLKAVLFCFFLLFSITARSATTVGVFNGGDAGEGLDLDGVFRYAIQSGAQGHGVTNTTIRDAVFRVDYNKAGEGNLIPGALVFGELTRPWGTVPTYGALPNDDALEKLMHGIVWMSNPST